MMQRVRHHFLYSIITPVFRFFIYSNIFIAVCAVLMTGQTTQLLLGSRPDMFLGAFIFFATLCSYSFHWFLTRGNRAGSPRERWLVQFRAVHIVLYGIGLAGSITCFVYLLPWWPWVLPGVVATFLYSAPKIPHTWFRALRKVALGKTIFLAFVWMYVTTVLPLVVSEREWAPAFTLFAISRFFLIYAICVLFDYRDREADKAAGIRSLITYFNEKGITVIFTVSLLVFAISALLLAGHGVPVLSVMQLLLPGLITAALYRYALRHFYDMLYYFILDGLMALSAITMMIVGF